MEWGEIMGIDFKEEYLTQIVSNEQKAKDNTRRISKLEEDVKTLEDKNYALYDMAASVKALSEGVVTIKEDVGEIKKEQGEMKSEIQDIKHSPDKTKARLIDYIGKLVITAMVSGILAFVLGQLAPSIFG